MAETQRRNVCKRWGNIVGGNVIDLTIGGAHVSGKADKAYRAAVVKMVSISVPSNHCHLFDAAPQVRIDR